LRGDLSGAPSFRELLARVRETALGAYAHPDLPFERLVAELNPGRDLGRSPLFQAMFVFHNAPVQRLELPGLSFELMEVDSGTARFELMLTLIEDGDDGDGVAGSLQWRTDLFETPTALRLVEHLGNLLAGTVAEPGARLRDLPLLGEAERQQLAVEWNDRRAGYPEGHAFHHLFAEQAARTPEAVAALCGGESWTYRELDQRAGRLARVLAREGVGPETLVALAAERGLGFLAAILAVWKAGGAYLPLDPRHPAERHRQILAEARPALLLHARDLSAPVSQALALLPAEARPPALLLEDLAGATVPDETGLAGATPDHLAYVIFTSGSTGVPKGAMVIQRGMVNHLWTKIADLDLTADDAVAQNASQCFDISVWQMLAPLAVGGRVVIYPDETAHDPARLLQQVERDRVSVLEVVPSLLRAVLGLPARNRPGLAALRWMIATGEALPADLVREWGRSYPRVPLLNAYGPTECSDDVTHHPLPAGSLEEALHVPIGRPVANTWLYLLDPALRPVPIGVTGQLWVGGEGVGRGYLGDPWRTARVFLPDLLAVRPGERMYGTGDLCRALPEGTLEFLGRLDNQVKVRGFRIELGEIEAVLAGSPELSEAAVVARREAAGGYRLVAFVVPAPGRQAEVSDLRKFVRQHLPEHMAPASFVVLDRLPLTANGKLDREALAAVDDTPAPAEEYVPPGNEVEETLAEVFASVIGAPRVGVYDNFFDLGGHSLLATQVVSRVRETFEVELTLRALFEAPTVAELAAEVERLIIEQIEALGESEGDGDESYPVLEAHA
jgi:amino acid adenylation domain-containing protein